MRRPHPIQWLREHPRAADGLLAALVTIATLAAHLFGESPADDPDEIDPTWWTVVLVLISTVPLAWRRIRPMTVALVVVAAEVTSLFAGITAAAFLGSVIAVYSMGAHTIGRRRTRVMAVIAVMVVALFVAGWIDGLSLIDEFVSTGVVLVTAFVIGDNLRRRRLHVADLAERAERAEREQALSTIEATGRRTMTELRSVLGVLRDDQASAGTRLPTPSLDNLHELLDTGDLPVSSTVEGDLEALPESIAISVYRIVQEALTNVRRHAGPVSSVDVALRIAEGRLRVDVTDDGRGGAADPSTGGFGLRGMQERVAALGGSIAAGPRPGGGWAVRVSIPLAEPAGLLVGSVGEAGDGAVPVQLVPQAQPDVVLMDVRMPRLDGIEACGRTTRRCDPHHRGWRRAPGPVGDAGADRRDRPSTGSASAAPRNRAAHLPGTRGAAADGPRTIQWRDRHRAVPR